ncbi:MAG: hypothetical protein AB7U95_39135 [Reyranella sp.]
MSSNIYLDTYDAAVLRFWAEMLSRHHRSLRRPYATGRPTLELPDVAEDRDGDYHQQLILPFSQA